MDLWAHQIKALQMAENRDNLALLMDMGTGKTRSVIEIVRRKYAKHGRILRTLIFAPIVVCENWKREWAKYSKIHPNDVVVLNQDGKGRVREFLRWAGEDLSRNKIFITNYHATGMTALYKLFEEYGFEVLIADESQRLKSPTGVMAKAVAKLSDKARYRYILTGSPVLNSPMDLFMQYRILDGGETFGVNYYSFRLQYCEDKNAKRAGTQGYFPKWEVRESMYPVFQKKIQPSSIRVMKSECLDLPPLIKQELEVALSPEQSRLYKEMKNEYIAFIGELEKSSQPRTITAQIAATKALRLQQIVSGFAAIEQTRTTEAFKEVPRMSVLEELLEAITPNNKVIVWACFKENYKMIAKLCESMKLEYAMIHGEISNTDKEKNLDRFRTKPECKVMIANQGAGGVGISMVEASYMIYYSKGFSLEHDLQSEARNYRAGSEQHQKITRIDLVARGTIDELINQALSRKLNVAEAILNWRG